MAFVESEVEVATLEWLAQCRYATASGPSVAPGEIAAERGDYQQVLLTGRLRAALARLNPELPADAVDQAFRRITRLGALTLVGANREFHRMLVDGVAIEYRDQDGSVRSGA